MKKLLLVGLALALAVVPMTLTSCGKENPVQPSFTTEQTMTPGDTTTGRIGKPGATTTAIWGDVGIRWPFSYSELPENWNGTDGGRTGGGTLANPCGTGQMNSHSQADYYSRDLSRKSGSSSGVPVYAGRTGIIIYSGNSGGYGESIVIWDPRENIQIRYAHLQVRGAWGGYVTQGQYLGRVGNTPGGFNPHLHLTVYKNIPLTSGGSPAWTGNLCRPQSYACSYHFY